MSWIIEQKHFHMTIGSYLQQRSDIAEFHNDAQMVKVALLYADHLKLVSLPAFTLLIDMSKPHDMHNSDPITYLRNNILWERDEGKKEKLIQLIHAFERAKQRRHSKRGREKLKELNQWFAAHL